MPYYVHTTYLDISFNVQKMLLNVIAPHKSKYQLTLNSILNIINVLCTIEFATT